MGEVRSSRSHGKRCVPSGTLFHDSNKGNRAVDQERADKGCLPAVICRGSRSCSQSGWALSISQPRYVYLYSSANANTVFMYKLSQYLSIIVQQIGENIICYK